MHIAKMEAQDILAAIKPIEQRGQLEPPTGSYSLSGRFFAMQ